MPFQRRARAGRLRRLFSPVSWYLRSLGDRDTHHGTQRTDGTVVALCGAVFEPRPLRIALPGGGDPPDREQICPQCYRAKATG